MEMEGWKDIRGIKSTISNENTGDFEQVLAWLHQVLGLVPNRI